METIARAIVIAAIIFGGALIVHGLYPADRYSMVAAATGGGAYRIDRLTGSVLYCDALVCRALPLATLVPGPAKPAPAPAPGSPRST
jgi:hypothetical protein